MRRHFILLFSLLCLGFSTASFAQTDYSNYNQTDKQGRRQGLWVDFFSNGAVRYTGEFRDGKNVGEFKYFDEQGNLKATNSFDKSGRTALNKTYAANGTLIATGNYEDQKKMGEWRYYSEETGKLILVEENKEGKVDGWSRVYNPETGKVAEESIYIKGLRQGESRQYFDTGILMMECIYVDNLLDGPAKVYYPSSALKEEGVFSKGEKHGIWKMYDEDGNEINSDNYGAESIEN